MLNAYRRYIISLFICYFNVDLIDRGHFYAKSNFRERTKTKKRKTKEKKNVLFRKWGFTLFLMKLYIAFCIMISLHEYEYSPSIDYFSILFRVYIFYY